MLETAPSFETVLPACRSREPEHRSARCRDCQRMYARRKRSAARGAFPRRKYRRKKTSQAKTAHASSSAVRARSCESPAPDHVARRCPACRKAWNRRYYLAQCARRRALASLGARAPQIQDSAPGAHAQYAPQAPPVTGIGRAVGPCFQCASEKATFVREESDFGTFVLPACEAHVAAAQKILAGHVAERFANGHRPTPSGTIGDVYARAMALADALSADELAELRNEARNVRGMLIAEDSPLYRSRFAALVHAAVASRTS